MTYSVYSSIGSPFGKLLRAKPKPIILAKAVTQRPAPFLQGFRPGSNSLKPLEEGIIDEIEEDVIETIFTLSLEYKGLYYTVMIGDAKDCWIVKEVRQTGKTIPTSSLSGSGKTRKKKPMLTFSFFVLVLVSVAGYIYEFKFNQEHTPESNPTVNEAFATQDTKNPGKEPSEDPPAREEDKLAVDWEKEKAKLEAKITTLQKENEQLKKQLTEAVPFTLSPGMDALQLSQAVQAAGLVTDGQEFNKSLVRLGAIEHLSPGTYLVVPGVSHEELIEIFTKGVVKKKL